MDKHLHQYLLGDLEEFARDLAHELTKQIESDCGKVHEDDILSIQFFHGIEFCNTLMEDKRTISIVVQGKLATEQTVRLTFYPNMNRAPKIEPIPDPLWKNIVNFMGVQC